VRALASLVAIIGLACLSAPAFAEVADKEPSIEDMWIWAVLLTSFILAATWWKRVAGYAVWAVGNLLSVGPILEWHDPFVGPVILRELGPAWGFHAYATLIVSAIVPGIAFVALAVGSRRRDQGSPD
jgi:hypothetical protein